MANRNRTNPVQFYLSDDDYSKTQPFLKEGNTALEDDAPEQ